MKKFTLLGLLIFSGILLFGQNNSKQSESRIEFRIHSTEKNHIISLYEPLDGGYNFLIPNHTKFKETASDSCFTYKYSNSYPAFIRVKVDNRTFHILLLANNFVTVDIYPDKNSSNWILFSGSNASGQKWYNDWTYVSWKRGQTVDKIFDSGRTNYSKIYSELNKHYDKLIYAIDSLKKEHRISSGFNTIIKKEIYFSIYTDVLKDYGIILSGKKYGNLSHTDSAIITNIKKKILSKLSPFTLNASACPDRQLYLNQYIIFNKTKTDSLPNKPYPFLINNNYYKNYALLPYRDQEYIWGYSILIQFFYNQDEFDKEGAIRFFKKKFPRSQYIPIIESFQKKYAINNHPKRIGSKIRIDTTAQALRIHSLKELHDKYFRGKRIFIDLWATWCTFCIKEFTYKDELDSIAKQYNVTLVYLSMDKLPLLKKWVNDVDYYKLKGYNFITNNMLTKNIGETIYDSQQILIPRYVFMNEKGEIISKNAPHPSSIQELEKLFSAYEIHETTKSMIKN